MELDYGLPRRGNVTRNDREDHLIQVHDLLASCQESFNLGIILLLFRELTLLFEFRINSEVKRIDGIHLQQVSNKV